MLVCRSVYSISSAAFSPLVVQATARSLIVDVLPESKQQLGSAWGMSWKIAMCFRVDSCSRQDARNGPFVGLLRRYVGLEKVRWRSTRQ